MGLTVDMIRLLEVLHAKFFEAVKKMTGNEGKRIFSTFVGVRRQAKERKKERSELSKIRMHSRRFIFTAKNDDGGVLSIVNMLGMDTQKNGDRLRKNLLG
jgi:hypothetical protein